MQNLTPETKHTSMGRLLKSSGRAQPGQGNELHALARSQRGPFPPAKPMSAVSQWLGFVPATVKPWQALIADGADPNAVDEYGRTPLHEASSRGNWQAVDYLLQAGLVAKINQRDHKGHTAIDLAIALGHKEVETLLSAYIARAAARQRPRGCPLLQMPVEVLVLILSWLEPRDLCTAAQACTVLAQLSREDTLWRRFCSTHQHKPADQSWRDCYREWVAASLRVYAGARANFTERGQIIKWALIGEHRVGKRRLTERYVRGIFRDFARGSMGADFLAKEVERGGKCLHIQLWDRPMACSTRLLCRGAVGLVYVYDVRRRETFDALAARHEEIVWHFPDGVPPIIIAGAKADKSTTGESYERQVSEEEAQALARQLNAVAWMETSSKDDFQVSELFSRLLLESLEWADPFRVGTPPLEEASRWAVPSACLSLVTRREERPRTDGGGDAPRPRHLTDSGLLTCVLQ